MRTDLIDKVEGIPILEAVYVVRYNAEDEFVNLGVIVAMGRYGYEIEGAELDEFIRRCLHLILDHGALPTINTGGLGYAVYEATTMYGTSADEIVENVIAAWTAHGRPDPEWGEYAFSTPDNIEPESLERFRVAAAAAAGG